MNKDEYDDVNLQKRLHDKYGDLMCLEEVANELKFPSADAVRKSLSRGVLVLPIVKIPQRRGSFVKTKEVVNYLKSIN